MRSKGNFLFFHNAIFGSLSNFSERRKIITASYNCLKTILLDDGASASTRGLKCPPGRAWAELAKICPTSETDVQGMALGILNGESNEH